MADGNAVAGAGHNSPPVDPYDAFTLAIDDNLLEAANWADGSLIETQAQADELSFLIDRLRKDAKAADDARTAEKKPHLDASRAVDAKWKGLLEKAERGVTALKASLSIFLKAQEAKRQEEARVAREAAAEASRMAAEAARAADATDLQAQEDAAELLRVAEETERGARKAETAKVHATGGTRAMGLKTYHTPTLADSTKVLGWCWANRRPEVEAALLEIVKANTHGAICTIPGVTVVSEQRV
jgi:hypothetical protein